MKQIGDLVVAKDFRRDLLFLKLVWAQVELAEAIDVIKKNGLPDPNIVFENAKDDPVYKLAVEMVDVVFYVCDGYRLLMRRYPNLPSMDEMFDHKMNMNMLRPKRYGNEWADNFLEQLFLHYQEEGLITELSDKITSLFNKYDC